MTTKTIPNSALKKLTKIKKQGKIYFQYNKNNISPWYNIPYFDKKSKCYNMICEIPKWTRDKFEVATDKTNHPIVQDKIDNKPRSFIYGDMMWNYGLIPQTYEDPSHIYSRTGKPGDGDPIDIIDIGYLPKNSGDIIKVKVLGVIPMIDDGETDWKIISINKDDPLSKKLNDINDVKKYIPGLIEASFNWFRNYKFARKGTKATFALNGKPGDKKLAETIINQGHEHWLAYSSKKLD